MAPRPFLLAAAASAGLFLAGAAAAQAPARSRAAAASADPAGRDPWEGVNRRLFGVNHALDRAVLRPAVVFYHHATPTPIRRGLHNVLVNMTEPIIIINDALQLRPARAAKALGRFTVNSTAGVGGVFDVASRSGLAYRNADFGLTLARYGVGTGPYLFIPVLGPTTVRDLVGRGVDAYADPFNAVRYDGRDVLAPTRAVLGGIDARDQVDPLLKDVNRTATDPYATIRSAYLQTRAAQVRGGATSAANVQALPDFGPAPGSRGGRRRGSAPIGAPAPATPERPAPPAAPRPRDGSAFLAPAGYPYVAAVPAGTAEPPRDEPGLLAPGASPSDDPVADLITSASASGAGGPSPMPTPGRAAPAASGL